jgi:hypothetical protein
MTPDSTTRVFVSYRREDTRYAAGRLGDRLNERFDHVFMDIDDIDPGVDFTDAIRRAVGECDILLALIGDKWTSAVDEQGRRRLDDPDDWIVQELRVALDRGIRVIPVLVDAARMPSRSELPEALAPLARRQAVPVRFESFTPDSERLILAIERTLNDIAESVAEPPDDPATEQATEQAPVPTEPPGFPSPRSGDGEPSTPRWRRFVAPVLAVVTVIVVVIIIIRPWHTPSDGSSATSPVTDPSDGSSATSPVTDPSDGSSATSPVTDPCDFADQFTGASLDPAWEVVSGTGSFVVAGGSVEITAQDGADIFMDYLQAPMLLRVPTGDFVFETEVAAEPRQWYQGAGLVLWNGSDSYVRLERGFGDVGAIVFEYRNGGPHVGVHSPSLNGPQLVQTDADPVVMQLSKTADAVSARWRPAQDQQWQELGTIAVALPNTTKAGVAVLDRAQNGTAPEPFSARFDYVRSSCA